MSMHTPGPWHIRGPAHTAGWGVCIAGASEIVARIPGRASARKEANARLIAAAPDLLEAVQNLLAWAEKVHAPGVTRINYSGMDAARAAITKATEGSA